MSYIFCLGLLSKKRLTCFVEFYPVAVVQQAGQLVVSCVFCLASLVVDNSSTRAAVRAKEKVFLRVSELVSSV